MAEIHDDMAEDMAAEKAAHEAELRILNRPTIPAGASTPWSRAQVSRQFADGIILHSTASHGGFHLAENANSAVHALFRNDGEFYEEDCKWAKVAHAFPQLFTAYERRLADRTLRDTYPDAYERVTGVTLNGSQSHMRDRQEFESRHRNDWVRQGNDCRVHRQQRSSKSGDRFHRALSQDLGTTAGLSLPAG